jgi:shikimate kinase
MNIYLTGYRCTGKTTVGALLAESLKWQVVDSDEMLVADAGTSISDIVAEKGWDAFREMEKETIKRIGQMDGYLVSTGGGVILHNENVECMKKTGIVIWLKARPETIHRRLEADKITEEQRPSLTASGLYDEIEEVLAKRTPLYKKAMDFSVDTDDKDIIEVRDIIIKELSCREIP